MVQHRSEDSERQSRSQGKKAECGEKIIERRPLLYQEGWSHKHPETVSPRELTPEDKGRRGREGKRKRKEGDKKQ